MHGFALDREQWHRSVVLWVRWAAVLVGVLVSACAGRSEQGSNDGASDVGGATGGSVVGGTGGSAGGTSTSSAAGSVGGTNGSVGGASGPTGTVVSSSSVGGSGGSTGAVGGSGGSAGEGDTGPEPCNSSDGSGCSQDEICLDSQSDACAPSVSEDCAGYCAPTLPPSSCDGGLTPCTGSVTCPALPQECPAGFVVSIIDECWGPCVPADCCACSQEVRCLDDDVSCNLATGRCVVPAAPEPRCSLPVDTMPCDGPRAFVFVDGQCQEQDQGLCSSNDNSFFTLEECLRRCEGLPQQGQCPEGRVARSTCLACGAGGGCSKTATVCAQACSTTEECDPYMTCLDSACGANFCI